MCRKEGGEGAVRAETKMVQLLPRTRLGIWMEIFENYQSASQILLGFVVKEVPFRSLVRFGE